VIVNESGDTADWDIAAGWRPSYEANGSPGEVDSLVGDFNSDLRVDARDLAFLQGQLATASGGARLTGDLSGDGAVSRSDIALFLARYGRSAAVPSPAPSSPAAAIDAILAEWRPSHSPAAQKLRATRSHRVARTGHLSQGADAV